MKRLPAIRRSAISLFGLVALSACAGGELEETLIAGGAGQPGSGGRGGTGGGGGSLGTGGRAGTDGNGASAGAAGAAGAAGKAGASGAAGKAGASGAAGKAGASGGGASGAAGKGGASGTAGNAGASGTTGAAGAAGASGSAGASGTAGASGAAGAAGSSGAGGGTGSCTTPATCPGQDTECRTRTCTDSTCGFAAKPNGTPTSGQTAGDCKQNVCDGNGATIVVNADTDLPVDSNPCTDDVCTAGEPSNPALPGGGSCGTSGVCDENGQCTGCNVPADCPGTDDECGARTCDNGVCGFGFVANGTPLATQITGDCKQDVCDGAGKIASVALSADLPNDNNTCTIDVCNGSTPSSSPATAGASCGVANVCDGAGNCVGCVVKDTCPGQDDDCQTRTCDNGLCGFSFKADGTSVPTQQIGDCRKNVCDGAGKVKDVADDADLPNDQKTCTSDVCTNGAPSNPPVTPGTSCGASQVCDALGQCVGCNVAADCVGADDECQARTCNAGVCGVAFTAANTPVAAQIAGDCSKNVCDGNGNTVKSVDNGDVKDDGNACTTDVCTAGVPSNPPTSAGAICGPGLVCDGASACVACLVKDTCPGQDTDCQTRTCIAGACGFSFQPANTAVPAQVPRDCKRSVCDGSGAVVSVNDNTDLPNDNNVCTTDVCTAGVPSNPPVGAGPVCGTNQVCNAAGQCVGCNVPTDCAGTDTDCRARTCTAGSCGFSFKANGTATTSQTPNDCKLNVCDGSGNIISATDNTDVPTDDGLQCTSETCAAGIPAHPPVGSGGLCNQGGGNVCNGAGACVQCLVKDTCPGQDNECQARTCVAGTCGFSFTPANTAVASQTSGDCKQNVCDGSGNVVAINANDPLNDGNVCTSDVCTAGVPSNPPIIPAGSSCGTNQVCSATGQCVGCNQPSDCTGSDTECQVRTCSAAGVCGVANTAVGTPLAAQTANDCQQRVCDGNGGTTTIAQNLDVPVDDGNLCTDETCANGLPAHPNSLSGKVCAPQSGGTVCNGSGTCVACVDNAQCLATQQCVSNVCQPTPLVTSISPADLAVDVSLPANIVVTFNTAMSAASLTGQILAGACSDNIQVSSDNFATCVPFSASAAVLSSGNTVATLTPQPGLLVNTLYRVRVTTNAQSAAGLSLASTVTQPVGFKTGAPATLCDGSLVISQVYGGGGNTGAKYKNDFVELHNRGNTTINLAGLSLQYASATNTTWNELALVGSILPGRYFLVSLAGAAGAAGIALPTADQTGAIDMAGASGKIALVTGTTQLPNGACPTPTRVIDFVGYGTTSCSEGAAAPTASVTLSVERANPGCRDTNNNSSDFTTTTATSARNSATAASLCSCRALNESDTPAETDYCVIQTPTSLSRKVGVTTGAISGRIFEASVTSVAGASSNIGAQLGYGPASSNPEYQAGWTWVDAPFTSQFGNDDEYQAAFFTPATAGSYRYVYRFTQNGLDWTYCDTNGAGSNVGLGFTLDQLGVLTATP